MVLKLKKMQVLRPAEMTWWAPMVTCLEPHDLVTPSGLASFPDPEEKKRKNDYYPPIEIIADTKTILAVSIHQRRFLRPS